MRKLKEQGRECKLSWMTLVFLPRYPEPHKVPTNPRWCPYAKGSPREGQAPRSSNSVESHGPSPHASGAPLPAPLRSSPPSPLLSFRPKMPRASFLDQITKTTGKPICRCKILNWWCLVFDIVFIALVPKLLPLWHQPPKRKTIKACRK
jgi:hypothetical protein